MPATVPGEFTVVLGAVICAETHRELQEALAAGTAGFLTLVEFAEVEAQGEDELLEGLKLLRGAVMAVAAPEIGVL